MGRARTVLLILISSAVLLEIVLQLASITMWIAQGDGQPQSAEILCVGDSYTFGVGASDRNLHSYPSQLEEILRQEFGEDLRVNNRGWPGQDSRSVLARLKHDLAEAEPKAVCILIGCNDRWNRPARLEFAASEDAVDPDGWQLQWRSYRLLKIALAGSEAELGPDERAQTSAAKAGSSIPAGAWRRLRGGFYEQAAESFRSDLESHPEKAPSNLAGLVETLMKLDRPAEVETALQQLEKLHSERRDSNSAVGLLRGLAAAYRQEEARERSLLFTADYPGTSEVWAILGWMNFALGNLEESEQAYAQAVQVLGNVDPARRATLLRRWSLATLQRDARLFANLQLRAWVLDRNRSLSLQGLRANHGGVDRNMAEAQLRELGLDSTTESEGLQLLAEAFADQEAYALILEEHLHEMISICKAAGATPLLLDYPFDTGPVRVAQEQVAAEDEVQLVSINRRFAEELGNRAREELFVADGHCNDAGYRLMAERVAAALREHLSR